MEHIGNFSNVFNATLLNDYYHLLASEEYDVLRENFYYNFENFAVFYKNRKKALRAFKKIIVSAFGTKDADFLIEILHLEENFDIDLISPWNRRDQREA